MSAAGGGHFTANLVTYIYVPFTNKTPETQTSSLTTVTQPQEPIHSFNISLLHGIVSGSLPLFGAFRTGTAGLAPGHHHRHCRCSPRLTNPV